MPVERTRTDSSLLAHIGDHLPVLHNMKFICTCLWFIYFICSMSIFFHILSYTSCPYACIAYACHQQRIPRLLSYLLQLIKERRLLEPSASIPFLLPELLVRLSVSLPIREFGYLSCGVVEFQIIPLAFSLFHDHQLSFHSKVKFLSALSLYSASVLSLYVIPDRAYSSQNDFLDSAANSPKSAVPQSVIAPQRNPFQLVFKIAVRLPLLIEAQPTSISSVQFLSTVPPTLTSPPKQDVVKCAARQSSKKQST